MARGGYRPGAGRPKGTTKTAAAGAPKAKRKPAAAAPSAKGETPLDYMLGVMNDPEADQARRDRMAIAAAPFMHPRVSDERLSKKDRQKAAAEVASRGRFAPGAPPRLVVSN